MVPFHRVIGKRGDLTGYHWGFTRKRAMLGWQAGGVRLMERFVIAIGLHRP